MSARSTLLDAAREWVADCSWRDLHDDDVSELSDAELIRGIRRHYCGGWRGFVDADPSLDDVPEAHELAREWDRVEHARCRCAIYCSS